MRGFLASLFSPAGLFLLVLLAGRLVFVQQVGLELSPDEAYYWDWSRLLDWGYYSKPPLVAWLIHLSTGVLGDTEYGVRVPAAFAGTFYLAFIYYLAQRMFDRRVGLWAAFAAAASPLASIYGFVMTIDPPLLLLWAACLCLGWQAAETGRTRDFLLLGVAMGLGLLTKQTMAAFPVFYLLWLWLDRGKRPTLRRPGPYFSLAVALGLLAPNLLWNARHGWVSLHHTAEHFEVQGLGWLGPLRFLAEQAGVITPVTFGLLLFCFYTVLRRRKLWGNSAVLYLFVLSALPLALVLPLSLWRQVNANWPYPFYTAGYVLLAALVLRGRWSGALAPRLRRLFFLGVVVGMVPALAVYQLPRQPEAFPPPARRLLYKFGGWKDLARFVSRHRKEGEIIIASRRDYAAEMAFYLPDRPRTYTFFWGRVRSQYDLWDGLPALVSADALLLLKREREAEAVSSCFSRLEPLGTWERDIGGRRRRIRLFRGHGLRPCRFLGPQTVAQFSPSSGQAEHRGRLGRQ